MLTTTQISNYIAKAQRANTSIAKRIRYAAHNGDDTNGMYAAAEFLSLGVNVLSNSNNGLDNLNQEIIVDEMIRVGCLNDFSGDPISFLTNTVIVYSGPPGPPGPPGPSGGPSWTSVGNIAAAGTNFSTATPITTNIVYVDTATEGQGVSLPSAFYSISTLQGSYEEIYNTTAYDIYVYPKPGDAFFGINPYTGIAWVAGDGLLVTAQNSAKLRSVATGVWRIN